MKQHKHFSICLRLFSSSFIQFIFFQFLLFPFDSSTTTRGFGEKSRVRKMKCVGFAIRHCFRCTNPSRSIHRYRVYPPKFFLYGRFVLSSKETTEWRRFHGSLSLIFPVIVCACHRDSRSPGDIYFASN